jgi:hypothetical protein
MVEGVRSVDASNVLHLFNGGKIGCYRQVTALLSMLHAAA